MSDKIRILQLGKQNWNEIYQFPENVVLTFAECFEEVPKKPYDICFLDRNLLHKEMKPLRKSVKAYTLFVTDRVSLEGKQKEFCEQKKYKYLSDDEIQTFLLNEVRNYFPSSYGEKFSMRDLAIAQGFKGKVKWNGNYSVSIQGDYGKELKQIAFWCNNVPIEKG